MKNKGFSLIEIIITVGLTTIFMLIFFNWYKTYNKSIREAAVYYDDRAELINKAELGAGSETEVTKNIYLKTVSANNLVLEYLQFRN